MSLPTLYVETTIPSYLTARRSRDLRMAADQQPTEDWWNFHRQDYNCYTSDLVIDEAAIGDAEFAKARLGKLSGIPVLLETSVADELTELLLKKDIIPAVAAADAGHIAFAAVYAIDFLLTWNCKHINNPHSLRRIERACVESGFSCPLICTPADLMLS